MLVEHTLFGIRDLVRTSIDRLCQFEPPEGYYGTFSGGKDSLAIKELSKEAGVKVEWHYHLTTVDPPELIQYIRQYHPDVIFDRPEETMWQLIPKKRLPPLRQMRYCCAVLKEGGGKGRLVQTGVRWQESYKRSKRRMVEICQTDNSKRFIHPVIDWTTGEIWEYIRRRNAPYCSLYDEGFKRLGCVMCPQQGTKGMRRDAARWPKIAAMYKWACNRAYDKAVADDLERPRNWGNGDQMYEWWISGRARVKEIPGQIELIYE